MKEVKPLQEKVPASACPSARVEDLNQVVLRDEDEIEKKNQDANASGLSTRIEQAETRTEQANTRAEQAETRTEQANTRTEQAETRTEQANVRTEQAETRMEQANTRTEETEARSEQALRASELSYRRLFEAAKDGILILDADTGRIDDVNPFLFHLLGFSRNEMIGKTVGELSPFKDIESNKVMLERLQRDGYVRYEDLPLETRDGRHVAVEFVSNVYEAGGKNVIQCNVRDITKRKEAETASLRLAAIVESSDDAIIGKDLNSIITSWNKGAENIFGYSASEMIGTSILRLVPADRQDEENHILGKIRSGEGVEHFETLRQSKDGRLINVSVTASSIRDTTGKVIGVSKVARDITERKAAEEKVRQLNVELEQRVVGRTAELEAANKELEAFNYSVSHDLRAPLRHILGFVDLLQRDAGRSLSEKNLRHLATISEAAKRMGDLIDNLLAFSRLGRTTLQKTEINLDELVRETLGDFQAETKDRNIVWEIHPLPSVRADRALLRMALVNLISNAVKFTSARAEATIEIGCAPSGSDEAVIFIRDNGAGFDPKYAKKLFGVFQRLHGQAEFEGTGIGLANVQRVILRHGGRAWAEGVVDGGATFYFSIPNEPEASMGNKIINMEQKAILNGDPGALEIVTEARHSEALLKTGALQSAIFNSANFSSIATDEKGVIQIFNVGAERMLGYAAADVVNKITPADISDPQEVIARAKVLSQELGTMIAPGFEALVFKASRGIEDIYELTYIRKDGSRFPAVVSVTALRGDEGGIIGYLLIGTDNTARKRAEEALLKAGALQNAIFNSANFSCIATDEKGIIQLFNVGAERMLGYTAAEVLNKVTPAFLHDPQEVIARATTLSQELGATIAPGFEALAFKASRGIEDIYELTKIRKDGSRFPAVVSVTALRDAQEGIIGYLLIGTDNTARQQVEEERKRLDQSLRDQQFYTRSLIESNIDALMTTDALGIISDVNKQMEALTGCTRDELIGAPFKNYFTDPERAEAGIKLVLREKKVTDYELTACARDGKNTVVSYNATTFYNRDRKLQGVFAAARDVTERKRFELALQETNIKLENARFAAERANLAKSDFLSNMSHELRTPLNAILGFAQLMESASPLPTASQRNNIGQILQAGWYLLKLINEILDLAGIESGKVSLSLESVSLSEIMCECEAMVEPQAQQRGIRMTFPPFDNPIFVSADRTRLKQIVINLLSNAIKYNREQGTVAVDCTVIAPERIRISVKDTGEGLSPEKLAQLFQPFNRLGQEAGNVTGTGIGLVVTKRLAELMEGVLGVESAVGVGSTFWCDLDSAVASEVAIQTVEAETLVPSQAPSDAPQHTLLYVEDNPANMQLVEQLIARRPDIRLLTAVDATHGIELARISQPDVILMDITLPVISGIKALKILREDPVTAHIPIVALSANAIPRDIVKGLEAGFFRYITKPIKVKEFMDTVNTALDFADKTTVPVA